MNIEGTILNEADLHPIVDPGAVSSHSKASKTGLTRLTVIDRSLESLKEAALTSL